MNWRTFLCRLTLGTLAAPLAVVAQQTAKIPRIGILRPGSPPDRTSARRASTRPLIWAAGMFFWSYWMGSWLLTWPFWLNEFEVSANTSRKPGSAEAPHGEQAFRPGALSVSDR
jgi:hypothetical protein